MPGEILPDPRAPGGAIGPDSVHVLQFHRTIPATVQIGHFEKGGIEVVDEVVSRPVYFDRIQQACAALGDRLEIRFYDHRGGPFDASVLDHLDEIRRLSIDGVENVRHPEAVGRLPRLTSLRFGPWRIDDARILGAMGVHRLTEFTLAATPAPAIDLAPLGEARSLRSLRLLGHGKNTEAIAALAKLAELALQPASKFSLAFINSLISLKTLKFVLGNAKSIGAIESLPSLHDLSFREVRSLEDLGSLERFPRLRRLLVSDQPRITELRVGPANAKLEHLYLYSVPRLQTLKGLSALPALKSFFAYDSRLNLPWSELPASLTHFQLVTKTVKGRNAHDAQVQAKGLIPGVHPGSQFFYK
jgi:protein phosphatase 1 regulatory subunit 7